jgi:cell shape-determining protein MreC
MKMRYQHLRTPKRVQRLVLPILPVLLAVLLVVFKVPVPTFMANAGQSAAAPLWGMRDGIIATVVATYDSLESKDALLRENEALHSELSALRRESFMARVLERENESLRTLVGRPSEAAQLLPASVINSDVYSPYGSFVIDTGSNQGVHDDLLVLTSEGIAVGTVHRTLADTAIVNQFSAPGVRADVIIEATTSVHASMTGHGGGTMVLSIPRDLTVAVDDVVILPNFPGNPVGTVAQIDLAPEDAYQTIYVRQSFNQYELRFVMVDLEQTWMADEGTNAEASVIVEAHASTTP